MTIKCDQCEDCGGLCERHPDKPWEGPHACPCGALVRPARPAIRPMTEMHCECRAASQSSSTRTAGGTEKKPALHGGKAETGKLLQRCVSRDTKFIKFDWLDRS
jgi:hypothetical protein